MISKAHKILKFELIKVEKKYNSFHPTKFYYNIILEDIDENILFESEELLNYDLTGQSIKYKLNTDNEVTSFELI